MCMPMSHAKKEMSCEGLFTIDVGCEDLFTIDVEIRVAIVVRTVGLQLYRS